MKKLAMGVAQLLSGLFLLALPIIFICGLTWVSAIVSPWLIPAFFWTLVISIFILGPLAVIRKTRGVSAGQTEFLSKPRLKLETNIGEVRQVLPEFVLSTMKEYVELRVLK